MALVTLAKVQTVTGISSDAARLSALIPLAESRMAKFVGVDSFEDDDYTELHSGEGAPQIVLKNVPVNSVASVKLTDGTNETTLDADTYTFDPESGVLSFRGPLPWELQTGDGSCAGFPEGFRNVEVAYNGGHATVPGWLEAACIDVVTWLYHNAGANLALTSQRLGQYAESRGPAGGAGGLNDLLAERLGGVRPGV